MFEKILANMQSINASLQAQPDQNSSGSSSSGNKLVPVILVNYYGDAGEALSRLKQATTIVAYQAEFECLSYRVNDLSEAFLIECFMGGLKEEIRLEVKVKSPCSLSDAIGMARLVEEKLKLIRVSDSIEEPWLFGTGFQTAVGPLGYKA